ncbi:hypothetical protein OKC48_20790 [Methylorubrum extorquens]|uniref:hypothetical protein n=1 Tax=Methylorubrum extorquens TaxID=408 RepID=UPI0022371C5F|nr:hypothetical protein [Methylorubrum extorquens]UYW25685.1 hypothetical protein OKC48_20790 [Methylorubrum extorquens]
MNRLCSMREALEDPQIFGGVLPGETWQAWRVVLIASQGEPLTPEEREIYHLLSGREREPATPCKEVWGVVGRRGGKTRAFAVAAAYFAGLVDYEGSFAPGQRGRLPVMAAARDTAREAFNYLNGIFEEVPMLNALLDGEPTAEVIRLINRVDIQVMTANFRTTRGPTPVAAVCDEIAFWSIEGSSNPDREILRALRPGLATLGGPLFVLSSPYARKGELYRVYRKDFGPAGSSRRLVIQAPTLTMHKSETLAAEIAEAYEDDPEAARAEYGAQFREDLQDFVSPETVERCTPTGLAERGRIGSLQYQAFVDMAGGGADSATLAIGHREGDRAVLDAVREMPAGTSPEASVVEFAETCKAYGVSIVRGDRYAGEWPRERFRAHGVSYEVSEKSKSDLYRDFLPMLNSGRADMLDVPKLKAQLVGLERRTARGGRDSIDHAPGGHDDVANAVAGCLVGLGGRTRYGMLEVIS